MYSAAKFGSPLLPHGAGWVWPDMPAIFVLSTRAAQQSISLSATNSEQNSAQPAWTDV
jgi:hypothetical protein